MIRENQKFLNILLIIIDLIVVLTLALFFAWYIRFQTNLLGVGVDNWGIFEYLLSLNIYPCVYTHF